MNTIKKLISLMMAYSVMISAVTASAHNVAPNFSSGKTPVELGFCVGNEKTTNKMVHSLTIDDINGDKVLHWKTNDAQTGDKGILVYSLPEVIDFSNGPVEILTEAKMGDGGSGLWSFPMLCNNTAVSLDNKNGNVNTYFGLVQHNDGLSAVRIAAGSNRAFFAHNLKGDIGAINPDKFCTYKYVIDPQIGGFRFFYKYEDDTEWREPYKDIVVDKTAEKDGVAQLPAGVFPTRQTTTNTGSIATPPMVDKIVSLKYSIADMKDDANDSNDIIFKNISVIQRSLDVLERSSIFAGRELSLVFNSPLDSATLDAISITNNGTMLKDGVDYTLSVNNSNVGENSILTILLKKNPAINTLLGVDISKDLNRNYGYAKIAHELSYVFECSDIYVSSLAGDDLNIGTKLSPYKTIEKAIETYKEIKTADYKPTIYILDNLTIDKTIVLGDDCDGITFSAYNSTPVSISAGYTEGEITLAKSTDLGGKLAEEHIGKIIKWDISGYENLVDDAIETDFSYYSPELVDNGKVQTIARWPDNDWAYTGEVTADKCSKDSSGYNDGEYIGYEFVTSAPIDSYTLDNAKIRGFWTTGGYRLTRGDIIGKGTVKSSLDVKVRPIISSEYLFHENRRYYLYNIPEEITSPGEYYIDYDKKVLYYYPKSDDYNLQLTGLKDGMFDISDCDDVTFYGLSLENTRGTVILGDNADRLTVDSCRIVNAGGRGIWLTNTYETEITRSYFGDLGDSSVDIHGGNRPTLKLSNSSINNCEFENGARIVGTYSPFIQLGGIDAGEAGAAIGISIENNYFHNHIHSAIIFEGNDFTIKNNIFDRVVTSTNDAGAIYSRANPTYQGNTITNNIFRNITTFKKENEFGKVFAVYCDDLLPHVTVSDNVFKNCSSPVHFGGGQGHTLKNNLFYDCWEVGNYELRWNTGSAAQKGGYLYAGIVNMEKAITNAGENIESWFSRYHKFKNYYEKIVEYSDAVEQGQTSSAYDILHIFDEEVADNICLIDNASLGIHDETNGKKAYFKIYQGSEKENQNVNLTNMYSSNDLSLATINGTTVTLDESLINAGYIAPDVSNAGINKIGIYELDDGKTENEKILNSTDRRFVGYAFENFDGYTTSTQDVSMAKELTLSGSGKIDTDGMLKIESGKSVKINLYAVINNDFALEIKHNGNLKIGVASSEFISSMTETKVNVYKYDIDKQKLIVYEKTEKKLVKIAEQNISIPSLIDEITLTAQSGVLIDWIGLTSFGEEEVKEGILDIDFESSESTDGRSIMEILDCFDDFASVGYFSSVIDVEENGNKAMKMSIQTGSEDSGYYSEFIFNPIKTKGNEINIEFSSKGISRAARNPNYLMAVVGFNLSAPESEKLFSPITENINDHGMYNPDIREDFVTAEEWSTDYVRLKYVIKNNLIYLYKFEDAAWKLVTSLKRDIPDYVNKLRIFLNQNANAEKSEYWIDDIKVYTTPLTTLTKLNNSVDVGFGYIPGIGATSVVAAYDKSGKLIDSRVGEYNPDSSISLLIDDDNYYFKRFIFEDLETIKPSAPARVLK